MKIAYFLPSYNDLLVSKANTVQELVSVIKNTPIDVLEQLPADFDIHDVALFLFVEMKAKVLEVVEKTDTVSSPTTYLAGERK